MTRVDNLSRLYDLLYSSTGPVSTNAKVSPTAATPQSTRKAPSRADLDTLVSRRLSGFKDDEEGRRRATRMVAESAMVWQFGEPFLESSNALNVVDELTSRLLGSDEFQALMGELLRGLQP